MLRLDTVRRFLGLLVLTTAALETVQARDAQGFDPAGSSRLRSLLGDESGEEAHIHEADHSSNYSTLTFRDTDEHQGARIAAFQDAVKHAGQFLAPGRHAVMLTVIDFRAARFFLPIFVASLKSLGGDLDNNLVVATVDPAAQHMCSKVHRPHLCVEEGLPSSLNGIAIDNSYGSDGRLIEGDQVIGWLKTIIGLRINQLGHKLLLLDSDSVFFSNPLESLDPAAHVAVTNDCDDTYHPKHNRGHGGANLGLTYFDSGPEATRLLQYWMGLATPGYADQAAFNEASEAMVVEDPLLEVQMLPRDTFSTFCCNYCDGFLHQLTTHALNWHISCPASRTKDWVMFHVACTGENRGYEPGHDFVLEKRHLMQAVWEMVMWHRQRSFFSFEVV